MPLQRRQCQGERPRQGQPTMNKPKYVQNNEQLGTISDPGAQSPGWMYRSGNVGIKSRYTLTVTEAGSVRPLSDAPPRMLLSEPHRIPCKIGDGRFSATSETWLSDRMDLESYQALAFIRLESDVRDFFLSGWVYTCCAWSSFC